MQFLYNSSIYIVSIFLRILALFSPKIKLFVTGRKQVFSVLNGAISSTDNVFWIHCASLGEFEQGRPIMEKLKTKYPNDKIVLSFFSPSGYEVQKKYELADIVVYLPLDSVSNVKKFIELIHPSIAVFVKYEFWPNYLLELEKRQVPTILVSGIFRESQVFFKSYGGWMRAKLRAFSHFFLQDIRSSKLLTSIGISESTVCGDTRFDRVYDVLSSDNKLDFIEDFVSDSYVLVAGSTWSEDESLLMSYICNEADDNEKFILAPHNIEALGIDKLKNYFGEEAVLFSEKEGKNLSNYKVFIIDTIGLLTKIYSYANVAYVGGGYTKSGVHNVLEPAVFGIPVVVGPNFDKFREVKDLIRLGGCMTIDTQSSLNDVLRNFKEDAQLRNKNGQIALRYIKESLGASDKILNYIATKL